MELGLADRAAAAREPAGKVGRREARPATHARPRRLQSVDARVDDSRPGAGRRQRWCAAAARGQARLRRRRPELAAALRAGDRPSRNRRADAAPGAARRRPLRHRRRAAAPGRGTGEGERRAGSLFGAQHRRARRRRRFRGCAGGWHAQGARARARRALRQLAALAARGQGRAAAGLHAQRQPLRFGGRSDAVRRARCRPSPGQARSFRRRALARLPAEKPAAAAAVGPAQRRPVAGVRAAPGPELARARQRRRERPESGRRTGEGPAAGRQHQDPDRRAAATREHRQAGQARHRSAARARGAQRGRPRQPAARCRGAFRPDRAGRARAFADDGSERGERPGRCATAFALEAHAGCALGPGRPARLARRDHLARSGACPRRVFLRRAGNCLADRRARGVQGPGPVRRCEGAGQTGLFWPGQRGRCHARGRARRVAVGGAAALPAWRPRAAAGGQPEHRPVDRVEARRGRAAAARRRPTRRSGRAAAR